MTRSEIGGLIRAARIISGLSLRRLGERVGVSHTMIRKYELAARPSDEIADRLRWALMPELKNLDLVSAYRSTDGGAGQ